MRRGKETRWESSVCLGKEQGLREIEDTWTRSLPFVLIAHASKGPHLASLIDFSPGRPH